MMRWIRQHAATRTVLERSAASRPSPPPPKKKKRKALLRRIKGLRRKDAADGVATRSFHAKSPGFLHFLGCGGIQPEHLPRTDGVSTRRDFRGLFRYPGGASSVTCFSVSPILLLLSMRSKFCGKSHTTHSFTASKQR